MTVAWSVPNYELLYRVEDTFQFEIEKINTPGIFCGMEEPAY